MWKKKENGSENNEIEMVIFHLLYSMVTGTQVTLSDKQQELLGGTF